MTLIEFLFENLGNPQANSSFIYYIIAGVLLLVFVDGVISFLLGGISQLTMRGR